MQQLNGAGSGIRTHEPLRDKPPFEQLFLQTKSPREFIYRHFQVTNSSRGEVERGTVDPPSGVTGTASLSSTSPDYFSF